MNKLTKLSRAIVAIAMMLTMWLPSAAQMFDVDGIYYYRTSYENREVNVYYKGRNYYEYNEYTGAVVIPDTVRYYNTTYKVIGIYANAFANCTELTSVIIPNSVTTIDISAFNGCTGLTNVTIGDGVKYIEDDAFRGCKSLASIAIPNSVTRIGEGAFTGCSSLQELVFADGASKLSIGRYDESVSYPTYNAQFYNCPIEKMYVGRNLTFSPDVSSPTIDNSRKISPFSYSDLSDVEFGELVTTIPDLAFTKCDNIIEITLPPNITYIGASAFNCANLLNITSLNTMPQDIAENAFNSISHSVATLTVPYKCQGIYAARTGWNKFNKIIEMEMPKVNLVIKFPENGTITHKEIYDETVDLAIIPNEGWIVNSMTFNDEDVTSQIGESGNYTTPVLTEDATLIVVFEKISTDIETLSTQNSIKVYANNGEIKIIGADSMSEAIVYNTMGAIVYKGVEKNIILDQTGVYILSVEGRIFKFAL